ncbi:2-succinyl-6-hydroxy-2,4-cyclohexadiene-1-carboxylate synthase [Oceanobacillus jeddahense]|uniref:Putative 2-succinyl-6-hydroxy-2,4-cyclohexadiene-1-carboxylate synthase n=1 Tax=Oceanobacillus jeddahense TaxID=1462527 RepID=A0ABY5JNM6_9BACI|nr:2-succinyl-6-hydroxy-2,4-cyclohexadiene-1-carboxylate synthase [Oceanobacillus jeddahense]UUI01907.1 2-succinyl-6-hydroxy-2,4-cyclohexadiene-1-carboxylate synthase [Oceanobacillus jeddahense]
MSTDGLQYEIIGEGAPVLFLHGFTGTCETWKEVCSYLTNYQCILVDLPGHGKTNSKISSMKDCCFLLTKLLDKLGIKKAHVVGYSMGGRTALSFAMYYPDYVATLILESSSPGLKEDTARHERKEKDDELAQRILENGIAAFVNKWQKLPLFATQKRLPAAVQKQIRNERLSQNKDGLAMSLRTMGTGAQPSWWEELPQLTNPTLLIAGEEDEKFIDINKMMQKDIPQGKLVICSKAGHAVHVEKSRNFGKMVDGFLSENHINITT